MSNEPSQVLHPWRATIRTVFATLIAGLVVIIPYAATVDWSDTSAYGLAVAVTALATRVLADPRVENYLRHRASWLSADPHPEKDTNR